MINESLLHQCISRERRALKECYDLCAPYVFSIVKTYFTDTESRKDAMQETFANLFNSLDKYDSNKGQFKSWLSRIAVNQCIGILRSQNKLKLFLPIDEMHEQVDNSEELFNNLTKAEIEELLAKMPTGYKTIFLLNVIDGYNHNEIAELLEITPETSRSQLSRSIKWIRKNLVQETKNYIYG